MARRSRRSRRRQREHIKKTRVAKKNFLGFSRRRSEPLARANLRDRAERRIRPTRSLLSKKQIYYTQAQQRARKNNLSKTTPKYKILSPRTKQQTICEKRYVREQVLHALKKTGLRGQKPPVRTNNVICRRK